MQPPSKKLPPVTINNVLQTVFYHSAMIKWTF